MKVGVQVYTIRDDAAADFNGSMKQISEMGYDGVELAGLYGLEAADIRKTLDELNLEAISAHVSYEELYEDLDKTLDNYQVIGCSYITIPMLWKDRLWGGEKYEETLRYMHVIAKACAKRGMKMLYHNHDFEFYRTDNETYALDDLFAEFAVGELDPEFDTCWVEVAGEDACAYLKKYQGRCDLIHVKDFRRKEEIEQVAVGDGDMDFPALVKTAKECGTTWLIVEQDDHPFATPLENIKASVKYLKTLEDVKA